VNAASVRHGVLRVPRSAPPVARIRSNGVRLVLVERADRLARDLMVGEVLLAESRKLGVTWDRSP